MRVAPTTGQTHEYTIYHWRKFDRADLEFLIELDGQGIGIQKDLAAAHKFCSRHARDHKIKNAGLTEAFGRNRQFLQGSRGGWTRYKGAE